MKHKLFRKLGIFIALLVVGIGFGVMVKLSLAGTGDAGFGWLWGGGVTPDVAGYQGMGWISMNDTNAGSGGGMYGVNIPATDGDLSGYAWSEYYGWISFNAGDVVGCPSVPCKAYRQGNTLKGWARILSIRDAGANAGGWSGWIQLDPPASSVTISGGTSPYSITGYAYSDELGWINFAAEAGFGGSSCVTVAPPDILQVCLDGIPVVQGGGTHSFSLGLNQAKQISVFYDSIADCMGTNVTATTTFTESNLPNDAISLSPSGSNPMVMTATGASGTSESVTIQYGAVQTTLVPTIICVETASCLSIAGNYCSGTSAPTGTTIAGVCGSVNCAGTAGTRICGGTTWREVAP